MTRKPLLSIIVPAHNEESRLAGSLEKIIAYLQQQTFSAELIVVENGSSDRTLEIAKGFERKNRNFRLLRESASGKGLAVRSGMLAAKGDYRFICDADLSMPIEEIARFLPPRMQDFDVAIASREAKGAARYGEPGYRHLIGRFFNGLVRLIALPGLNDTQCGFKCFTAESAQKIFPLQTMTGWAFDVEVLVIARKMEYRIVEVPIPWHYNAGSRVHIFRDSFNMAMDLLRIRRNARKGLYG